MTAENVTPPTPTRWHRWLLAGAVALEAAWLALLAALAILR